MAIPRKGKRKPKLGLNKSQVNATVCGFGGFLKDLKQGDMLNEC
jgi:hypothetical protein